jgi:hypothetical protein
VLDQCVLLMLDSSAGRANCDRINKEGHEWQQRMYEVEEGLPNQNLAAVAATIGTSHTRNRAQPTPGGCSRAKRVR